MDEGQGFSRRLPLYEPRPAAHGVGRNDDLPRAIVFAVYSRRREIWVGWSSVKAIIGTKLALGYLNHYLASRGYSLQMTDEPADPATPDNLFEPLPGDFGAHGRFDDRATDHCVQLWATRHRSRLLAAFTVFAAV